MASRTRGSGPNLHTIVDVVYQTLAAGTPVSKQEPFSTPSAARGSTTSPLSGSLSLVLSIVNLLVVRLIIG